MRTLGRLLDRLTAFEFFEVVTPLTSRAGCFVGLLCLEVRLVVNDVCKRIPAMACQWGTSEEVGMSGCPAASKMVHSAIVRRIRVWN